MADFSLGAVETDPFGGAAPIGTPAAPGPTTTADASPKSGGFKLGPVESDPFREPSTSDVVASGLVSGLGARTLGAPMDVSEMLPSLINPSYWRAAATFGQKLGLFGQETANSLHGIADTIQQAPLTSHWWNEKLGQVGLPTTDNTHPGTTGGKLLQHGVEGASSFVAPSIAAKIAGVSKLPGVAEVFKEMAPGSDLVNTGIGAVSGVAGETAAELYPKSPIARPLAELVTGGLGAGIPAGVSAIKAGAEHLLPPMRQSTMEPAAQRAGVHAFDAAATNPDIGSLLEQRLASDNAELLKGSMPTSAELGNDRGLAGLQRARERLPPINPDQPSPSQSMLGEAVAERRAANNDARVGAVNDLAPATASPEAAQDTLRQYLADIDTAHAKWIDYDRQNAEKAREPITATMTPEEQGQAARSAIDAQRAPEDAALATQEQGARENLTRVLDGSGAPAQPQTLETASRPSEAPVARSAEPLFSGRLSLDQGIGGAAATGSPEERAIAMGQYGAAMRDPVQQSYLAERARLNEARKAIDPDGTMGMRPTAIKLAVEEVKNSFSPDTFGGMENKFYDRIGGWGDLIPVDDAFRLRADINSRLRNVMDHSPQETARLMILKRGVDQAVQDAVSDTHVLEQAGTANQGLPGVGERLASAPTIGSNVYTPTGRYIDAQYEVADMARPGTLVTSHDIEGTPNPAYPQELQPRDRSRAASSVQIRQMARELQPERLGASVSAGEGAPIIGPDGVVESGNGRVLALQHAYETKQPSADAYRQFLADQGHDTSNMTRPILVRRRVSPLSDEDRQAFTREANAAPVAAMSSPEQAAIDAKKLGADTLSSYRGGNLASAENRGFVRQFVRDVPSPGEEGKMLTPQGSLSLDGERRIGAALLHRAYEDNGLVRAMTETGEENIRAFGNALADASGTMARLRSEIEAGNVPRQFDISDDLLAAARVVARARGEGETIADAVAQIDAFNPLSKVSEDILRTAYGDNLRGRASRARLSAYLDSYGQEASRQSAQPQLLADEVTPERILEFAANAAGRAGKGRTQASAPRRLGDFGESGGADGSQARGSGSGETRAPEPSGSQANARSVAPEEPTKELTPLTSEAREQFAQWNREYAEMARQYRGESGGQLHAVGKMLQKGGAYDSHRLADSEVPWLFLNGGKTGREAVDRFLTAAKNDPGAVAALDDSFAFSLRRAAQREDGTLDLGKYQRWLDSHEGALSARPELLGRFNTAKEAQQRLDDVRQSLAEHEATYPLSPGWGNSGILPQFFKPGTQGAETMRRYLDLAGNRPEAVAAAEDYAALKFASQPGIMKDGQVNPKAAETWLKQYDSALSSVPGLKDKFSNAVEAQKAVEAAINRHIEARNDFTKSVAGAFIGDDPERAIRRVFTGSDRAQKAKTLVDLLGDNKPAIEGLQRAAIDHILSEFRGAPTAGSEVGHFLPQRMQDFVAENRSVLDVLFPDGGAKTFDALAEDLKRSQIVQSAKQPGGSDTAELMGRNRSVLKESSPSSLFTALIAEHIGQHLVGHLGGLAAAILAPLGAGYIKAQRGVLQVASNAVLDRMLLDPAFAVEMKRAYAAETPAARSAVLPKLQARLMNSLIQAARSEDLKPHNGRTGFAHGGAVVTSPVYLHWEASRAHPEPTDAQKESGNYQKGHIVVQGMPIAIENAKGSIRRGVGPTGKPWHVRMPAPYGYIKRTEGADAEPIDVYVGDDLGSDKIFVIDQKDARTKRFDEHKAMIAFPNRAVALANYRKAFSDGRGGERIGGVSEMTVDEFKQWLKTADTTKPLLMGRRADGGSAGETGEPWRGADAGAQAKHFADLAERIRQQLSDQALQAAG